MALQFEHPTIAGVTVGGWMNRADAKPKIVQVCCSCAYPLISVACDADTAWLGSGGWQHSLTLPKRQC